MRRRRAMPSNRQQGVKAMRQGNVEPSQQHSDRQRRSEQGLRQQVANQGVRHGSDASYTVADNPRTVDPKSNGSGCNVRCEGYGNRSAQVRTSNLDGSNMASSNAGFDGCTPA